MNIDFNKFLELLESNQLTEASAADHSLDGKVYAEMANAIKWGYIPHPKDGKDYGKSGTTKLFVRELGDQWDVLLFRQSESKSTRSPDFAQDIKTAQEKFGVNLSGKRPAKPQAGPENQGMIKDIQNLQALTESMFGTGKMTNEAKAAAGAAAAAGGGGKKVEGDESMLSNKDWTVVERRGPFPFEQCLRLCVAAVTGKSGEGGGAASMIIP